MPNKLYKGYRFILSLINLNYWKNKKNLILVYTLSKVGSSTVFYSLVKQLPLIKIFHVHFLGQSELNKEHHPRFNRIVPIANKVFKAIEKGSDKRIKIITLVRDPVARDISAIFQAWEHIFGEKEITDVSADEINSHLAKDDFKFSENWFKVDFLEFTGLNLYKDGFNIEQGYQIYKTPKADILCIKLESLNGVYKKALKEFLGINNMSLVNQNESLNKESAALNKKVKESFRIPENKLRLIYNSDYMKTFYSKKEIKGFISKWKT